MRAIRLEICVVFALGALLQPLFLVNSADAAVIPTPGAEASASARTGTNDAGTVTNQGAVAVGASRSATDPDFASSRSSSTVAGPLRSESEVDGAAGNQGSSQAGATAKWTALFNTVGANPGRAIDIGFNVNVDGDLTFGNNNSNVVPGDVLSGVSLQLSAVSAAGTTSAFNGSAQLSSTSRTTPPSLIRSGDWASPSRNGDFTFDGVCNQFGCEVDIDSVIALADAFFVDFNEVFAIEFELSTEAFIIAGLELGASADFFNTGTVSLFTNTPGVSIQQASAPPDPDPVPVPVPGTLPLLTIGLLGVFGLRRRLI